MDLHFESVHAERLPFILLPPGTSDMQHVLDYYRGLSRDFLAGRRIDWSRLEKIESLGPNRRRIGRDSKIGYVLFEFPYSDRVVLECPIEGNATYILWGDWERMARLTKAEIRRDFPQQHVRVVHRGDWFHRIRRAVRAE